MMEYNDKLVMVCWWIWNIMAIIGLIISTILNTSDENIFLLFLLSLSMMYISFKMLDYWLHPEKFKKEGE